RINTDNEQIVNLCQRYWQVDNERFVYKISELSREFSIPSTQVPRIVAQYSYASTISDVRRGCGTPYVFSSRTDFQQHNGHSQSWKCNECRRKEEEIEQAKLLASQERYRLIIREEYAAGNPGPIDPLGLAFDTAVYLLSFIRLA